MIEKCHTRFFALLRRMALVAAFGPLSGAAQEACDPGIVFGFFNGVQTTEQDAKFAAHRHLAELYGMATPKGDSITTYDLFYNDTQGFADFVETFDQRLHEHGDLLAGRFELFFSAARGEGFWWKALTSAIPSLVQFLDDLFDLSRAALMRELTSGLGDPNMGEVAARHREQIDLWAGQQKKMLFFAHSQGNLFVNRAYAHAASKTEGVGVKVVHVAPASPTLSGAHTLADKDMVINGLRLIGSVVPNTTEIPPYMSRPAGLNGQKDLIGHGLLEIYLNPALATAGRITEHVLTALRELDALPRKPMPPFPEFVANSWQGGPEPLKVYAPDEATHSLERIVEITTKPRAFIKYPWGWGEIHVPDRDAPTDLAPEESLSIQTFGPGMNGSEKCEWGNDHLEGWGLHPFWRCTYERMPVGVRIQLPDELKAHETAPLGTVVHFNTLTNAHPFTPVSDRHTQLPFIGFKSGWEGQFTELIKEVNYWNEPYRLYKPGAWLNEAEYRAWWTGYEAHRQEEVRRYDRYLAEKADYEEKRRRCAAASA